MSKQKVSSGLKRMRRAAAIAAAVPAGAVALAAAAPVEAAAVAAAAPAVILVQSQITPAKAEAAGFVPVSLCRTADGRPAAAPIVRFNPVTSPAVAEDTCASGGALELAIGPGAKTDTQQRVTAFLEAAGSAHPNNNWYDVSFWRSFVANTGGSGSSGYTVYGGAVPNDGEKDRCSLTVPCGSESAPPLSNANRIDLLNGKSSTTGDGHHGFTLNLFCVGAPQGGEPAPCTPSTGVRARARIYRVAFKAADPSPPIFSGAPTGLLATPEATIKGTQTLTYSAADPTGQNIGTGGIWKAEVLVDGQPVTSAVANSNNGLCAAASDGSFASPSPCKSSVTDAVIALNTSTVPNGPHQVALRVTDAADNTALSGARTVTFANPATNTGRPTLAATGTGSLTSPKIGDTLTSTPGDWSPTDVTLTRSWQRCDEQGNDCIAIASTGESYKLTAADVGKTIRVRVDGVNAYGGATASSLATSVVSNTPAATPGGSATSPNGDFDGDGIVNSQDPDTDNDGVPNVSDPAPYDASVPKGSADAPGTTTPGKASTPPQGAAPGPVNGVHAAPGAKLVAAFAKRRGSTGISRFGQSATIRGRLTTKEGTPIGGAKLDLDYLSGAGKSSPMSGTTTLADGSFSVKLPSNIGSRQLTVSYRYDASRTGVDVTAPVSLKVISSMTLRVQRSRGLLVFTGKAGIPGTVKKGRRIAIEYRVGRGAWKPFAQTRTSKTGSFSIKFRPAARLIGKVQFHAIIGSGSNAEGAASKTRSVRFSR